MAIPMKTVIVGFGDQNADVKGDFTFLEGTMEAPSIERTKEVRPDEMGASLHPAPGQLTGGKTSGSVEFPFYPTVGRPAGGSDVVQPFDLMLQSAGFVENSSDKGVNLRYDLTGNGVPVTMFWGYGGNQDMLMRDVISTFSFTSEPGAMVRAAFALMGNLPSLASEEYGVASVSGVRRSDIIEPTAKYLAGQRVTFDLRNTTVGSGNLADGSAGVEFSLDSGTTVAHSSDLSARHGYTTPIITAHAPTGTVVRYLPNANSGVGQEFARDSGRTSLVVTYAAEDGGTLAISLPNIQIMSAEIGDKDGLISETLNYMVVRSAPGASPQPEVSLTCTPPSA